MLLSKLAWKFYWIGCNVQRAEDNARVALAQRTIANRLGQDTLPLAGRMLEVLENRPRSAKDELSCLRYLLSDPENPFSVTVAFDMVDIDLRSVRGYVPSEAQQRVRTMRRHSAALASAGPTTIQGNLEGLIRDTLSFAGLMSTGMLRDEAYLFWQVGRQLAAAEMTCALVQASLMCDETDGEDSVVESVLWVQVLSALGMLDAYHLCTTDPVDAAGASRFAVSETRIGHSVAASLAKASTAAAVLPSNGRLLQALSRCRRGVRGAEGGAADQRARLRRLAPAIGAAMQAVSKTYFPDL